MSLLSDCNQVAKKQSAAAAIPIPDFKIKGLTLVAPPDSFSENPMPPIQQLGANWVAVIPYAFTPPEQPVVRYDVHGMQWWGERPEGVRATVRLAHEAKVKVMLKPQIWIPRHWTGSLTFSSSDDWKSWEQGYQSYILGMAKLAEEEHIDLFCIGTEFRTPIRERPQFWSGLIDSVRAVYSGKLVYSANWDDWEQVPFWSKLDYIGLSGYFPLIEGDTPPVDKLIAAWRPIKERLAQFSKKAGKPILFTEYGYLSVDGSGWRNWELEQGVKGRNINEQAQANCYQALFATFQQAEWWAGGFLWKWFPNMEGHEGYPERDYTPQGKLGEQELQKWYGGR